MYKKLLMPSLTVAYLLPHLAQPSVRHRLCKLILIPCIPFALPFSVVMPSGSSRPSKPKPSEVAADTRKNYLPMIKKHYASTWPTHSYLYQQPLAQCRFVDRPLDLSPPHFCKSPSLSYSGKVC